MRLRATWMHRDLRQCCCPVTPVFRRQASAMFPLRTSSAAAAGDPIADEVFQDAIVALGRASGLRPPHGPELIVVSGGMAASGAALLQPLIREVQAGLAWRQPRRS